MAQDAPRNKKNEPTMKLSIVTTLYQSAPYVAEFHRRASASARQLAGEDFEIIFVNDGSPDQSRDLALALAKSDSKTVLVDLSRNFGHHKAMMTALSYATGERIFLIDSDLEEAPEWLFPFDEQMTAGSHDMVFGVQESRKGGFVERVSGTWFWRLFNALTGLSLTENMVSLAREGKIRHWGVSRWTGEQMADATALSIALNGPAPISNQCPYNLLNDSIEKDVLPAARRSGTGVLAYSPLAQGVLTGKYSTGAPPPPGTRAADPERRRGMWDYSPENLAKVENLRGIADGLGVTLTQLSLAWCLRYPEIASVILGASRPDQILESLSAEGLHLDTETLARISGIMEETKTQ